MQAGTRPPARPDDGRDATVLERCKRIPTGTWSDALDTLRLEGVARDLAARSGGHRIAGPAVTFREEIAPLGTFELARFDIGAIIGATPPGSVAVIAMGGAAVSSFGGLAARAAVSKGIAGFVIDGGCRDLEEIRSLGLYLASRHVTPLSGKLRVSLVEVGGQVTCGGVTVHTGDLVVADQTGVVVVPSVRIVETLAVAEGLEGNDRAFERRLSAGEDFETVAAELGHL